MVQKHNIYHYENTNNLRKIVRPRRFFGKYVRDLQSVICGDRLSSLFLEIHRYLVRYL